MAEVEPEVKEVTDNDLTEIVSEGLEDVLGGEEENEQTPGEEDAPAAEQEEGAEAKEGDGEGEADPGEPEAAAGEAEPLTLDYSVPEGLNERSTERFNKLVEDNKSTHELVKQHEETLNGMRQLVADSGLTNEEYLGAIDFASEVKRDPAKGMKRMQDYMMRVSKETGIPINIGEVDYFEDYPDIKQQIEDMELTETAAIEVVRARKAKEAEERQAADQRRQAEDQQAYADATAAAIPEISVFVKGLEKNDIDWQSKQGLMFEAAKYAKEHLHPTQWKAHLEQEYEKINRIAGAVAPKRTETPLTDKSTNRGGMKEPTTIGEALDQLL